MFNHFETGRFDLLKADRVNIANQRFGRDRQGVKEVWIESSEKGERFLSRPIVQGEAYAVRTEIYTTKCYILREKKTGRYWFLDMNDRGFWLHNDTFSGAETFSGEESTRIEKWLVGFAN
jgi:hypothetical protein